MADLIINQAKILDQIGGLWIFAFLIFVRCLAFTTTAPLIGNKSLPVLVKISIAMLLTIILMPTIDVPQEIPRNYKFVYLLIMNSLVGMLIGWITGLLMEIGRTAGEMLDMQMGLNAATLFDPGSQTQTTIVGKFFDYIALVLFISVGGVEKIIEGFHKSFITFPIVIYEISFSFEKILKATSDVIAISFLIISPIIVIVLTIDLILGLMSRAAPQINAFQISFSIKPLISLILLLILLPALIQILGKLFSSPMRFY